MHVAYLHVIDARRVQRTSTIQLVAHNRYKTIHSISVFTKILVDEYVLGLIVKIVFDSCVVRTRNVYKLCMLAYAVHHGQAPPYSTFVITVSLLLLKQRFPILFTFQRKLCQQILISRNQFPLSKSE